MTIQAFFDKASQRKNFINELSGRALVGAQDTQFNPKAHFICFDPVRSADKARLIMLARNCGAVLINDAADDAVTGIFAKKYENLLKENGIKNTAQCVGENIVRFFVDDSIRMQLIVFMISVGLIPTNSRAGLEYVEYEIKSNLAA